ncbi:MAG: arginyltransferase [Gammaproteobacteria bacterium]|nr:MAG: arginyltransferase [Gammaproteobacteria bacterium]
MTRRAAPSGGPGPAAETRLELLHTPPHPCDYLPGREAVMQVLVPPLGAVGPFLYEALLARGFRRSGPHVYRPGCPGCRACLPARIPVDRFRPDRAQRRNLRRNAGLRWQAAPGRPSEEHFALYRRYLAARHPGGGMDEPSFEAYRDFLFAAWLPTVCYELRLGGRLLAVAVTDRLPASLSAVYTFYEPEEASRGLGVHALLRQVAEARRLGLRWLYLGYWIRECPKMSYKGRYRPLEVLQGGRWRLLGPGEAPPHC